jgi:hypothetical protein
LYEGYESVEMEDDGVGSMMGPVACIVSRDHPPQFVDLRRGCVVGSLRCTPRGELLGSFAVDFSSDGSTAVVGHARSISVHDVDRSGTTTSETSWFGRTRGAVCSVSVAPVCVGDAVVAVGTFAGSLALWDVRAGESGADVRRHSRGVTALRFSACGTLLASSSRGDDTSVCVWDVRFLRACVAEFERPTALNQRLGLGWDFSGKLLASGAGDGRVRVWDLHRPPPTTSIPFSSALGSVGDLGAHTSAADECFTFHPHPAHGDTPAVDIALHPSGIVVAVASGRRTSPAEDGAAARRACGALSIHRTPYVYLPPSDRHE